MSTIPKSGSGTKQTTAEATTGNNRTVSNGLAAPAEPVDPASSQVLEDAESDYVDTVTGSGFTF
jgi:Fe-S cluster assembly iron-binding protein IscA